MPQIPLWVCNKTCQLCYWMCQSWEREWRAQGCCVSLRTTTSKWTNGLTRAPENKYISKETRLPRWVTRCRAPVQTCSTQEDKAGTLYKEEIWKHYLGTVLASCWEKPIITEHLQGVSKAKRRASAGTSAVNSCTTKKSGSIAQGGGWFLRADTDKDEVVSAVLTSVITSNISRV